MNNKKMSFARGMGVGLVVGSVVAATIKSPNKKSMKKGKVSNAIRTMGDVVENIGNAMNS